LEGSGVNKQLNVHEEAIFAFSFLAPNIVFIIENIALFLQCNAVKC
jgi:hypothetical protein